MTTQIVSVYSFQHRRSDVLRIWGHCEDPQRADCLPCEQFCLFCSQQIRGGSLTVVFFWGFPLCLTTLKLAKFHLSTPHFHSESHTFLSLPLVLLCKSFSILPFEDSDIQSTWIFIFTPPFSVSLTPLSLYHKFCTLSLSDWPPDCQLNL